MRKLIVLMLGAVLLVVASCKSVPRKPQVGAAPTGMVLVSGGYFQMGDNYAQGPIEERPVHVLHLDAFYMDKYEVTKTLWDEICSWSQENGYEFENKGFAYGADHPVFGVNWYDCAKWCNARSEKEELEPCYYTTDAQDTVYRTGRNDLLHTCVKWNADGYRL
ncbi:MAG: formylglycine-generating enzyme family protein, partial [Planctomycetota bacterium]